MYWLNFIFEKDHKYFKTRYVCEYVPGTIWIFEDFETRHSHDNLLGGESFKKLVLDTEMKMGFRFRECGGGYGAQLEENRFNFIFNDDIDVFVWFEMGDGRIAVYDLDLDKMELSEDCRVF